MEPRVQGAWIVHHAAKIEEHGQSGGLNNLRKAGNCGMLLSALSASEQNQLGMDKVNTLAEAAGFDLTYQLPALLDTLEAHALTDRGSDAIEVLGLTTRSVLEHTGKIFESLSPKSIEVASVEAAEICSQAPHTASELGQYLSDQHHLERRDVVSLMRTVETYKLCDVESLDKATKIYFNGSLFRSENMKKTKAVIDSLTVGDQGRIRAIEQQLAAEGCIEKKTAVDVLGDRLFKKLHSIGMYDVSTVGNDRETVEYITRPSAFNKFGRSDISDAFDLAKALLAVDDPVGPENDVAIRRVAFDAGLVVAAWGVHGALNDRGAQVAKMLQEIGVAVFCLGTTKAGHPKHPLYLPKNAKPQLYGGMIL